MKRRKKVEEGMKVQQKTPACIKAMSGGIVILLLIVKRTSYFNKGILIVSLNFLTISRVTNNGICIVITPTKIRRSGFAAICSNGISNVSGRSKIISKKTNKIKAMIPIINP